ncbi:uncharacterized protein LOC132066104 [Lycium ferocissimum]|uniref:uncharacterized protein LOC132066104 n=1 Tax=Lycium ferocissimum TaxID=112874 RepID=UPI00281504D5|nr:uncharacterized protein LOC132066104 [Lycium ferocissimum]
MIFGGPMIAGTSFTASRKMKILVIREKSTPELPYDDVITFSDEDTAGITLPYNYALVITVLIGNCQVKRLMIDPGSSANILHWKVMAEMGLLKKMIPASRMLSGFNMSSETIKGEIDLPIEVGEEKKSDEVLYD